VRDRGGGSGAEEGGWGLPQPVVTLINSGGAAASRSSGLAAVLLGFWGGTSAGGEGVLWACLRDRGVRVLPESVRNPGRSRSGASCSSRTP
jgi:hypothetical protein